MSRLPFRSRIKRGIALALAAALATLALAEVGTRIVMRAKGRPHSVRRTREVNANTIRWLANSWDLGPTLVVEDSQTPALMPGQVLSPFVGVDQSLSLDGYVEMLSWFGTEVGAEWYDVLVLGGSVAGQLAADGETIEQTLASDPRLQGRRVRVHNQARGGFKAPQTSILASLLFQLGWQPDVVLLVDGFNEVAFGNSNRANGTHPLYPSLGHWASLISSSSSDPKDLALRVEMVLQARKATGLLDSALKLRLHYSALASRLVEGLVRSSKGRYALAAQRLTERNTDGTEERAAVRGPPPPTDCAAGLAFITKIWAESSVNLAAMCRARGVPFVHVLQPTLYDEGSKPVTRQELDTGPISEHWKEGVVLGYPLLREAGRQLSTRGVAFFDASKLFEHTSEPVYVDCCHFAQDSTKQLAKYCAERILSVIELPVPR